MEEEKLNLLWNRKRNEQKGKWAINKAEHTLCKVQLFSGNHKMKISSTQRSNIKENRGELYALRRSDRYSQGHCGAKNERMQLHLAQGYLSEVLHQFRGYQTNKANRTHWQNTSKKPVWFRWSQIRLYKTYLHKNRSSPLANGLLMTKDLDDWFP